MVYKSYYKSVCRGYPVKYPSILSSGEEISFPPGKSGPIWGFSSLGRYLYSLRFVFDKQ